MAFGYIIGVGGGGLLEKTGDDGVPVFITSDGEAKVCSKITLPVEGVADQSKTLLIQTAATNKDYYIPFVSATSDYQSQYVDANGLKYNPSTDTLSVSNVAGTTTAATKLTVNAGSSTYPIYFSNGVPVQCDNTLANSISGNAATATKLNTDAGSASYPVYFSSGKPVQCNGTLANSISGNAATASYCSGNCAGKASSADKLNTDAGSSTYPVYFSSGKPVQCNGTLANSISGNAATATTASSCSGNASTATTATNATNVKGTATTSVMYVSGFCSPSSGTNMATYYNASVYTTGTVLRNAAWNDYAEYRICNEEAGTCVIEVGDGTLIKSIKRLQKGASIVSDTFGMAIGPDKDSQAIALSGRVLARHDNSKFKVGDAVCAGKDGTVSKMNRLEIILFPDRIIGYVSEFPIYTKWNGVEVNNRIWIRIK